MCPGSLFLLLVVEPLDRTCGNSGTLSSNHAFAATIYFGEVGFPTNFNLSNGTSILINPNISCSIITYGNSGVFCQPGPTSHPATSWKMLANKIPHPRYTFLATAFQQFRSGGHDATCSVTSRAHLGCWFPTVSGPPKHAGQLGISPPRSALGRPNSAHHRLWRFGMEWRTSPNRMRRPGGPKVTYNFSPKPALESPTCEAAGLNTELFSIYGNHRAKVGHFMASSGLVSSLQTICHKLLFGVINYYWVDY